jgi:hypothetical protein
MGSQAWAEPPGGFGDRIDVTDGTGQRLGWVDPHSGARQLLVPDCRDVFDDVVDFWLTAAGLAPDAGEDASPTPAPPEQMRVTETRFGDSQTVRTLVIPLVPRT